MDPRDQRLPYQLAALLLDPRYADWIAIALSEGGARSIGNPWAAVQTAAQRLMPGVPAESRELQRTLWKRLLRDIYVPVWARDPAVWHETELPPAPPPEISLSPQQVQAIDARWDAAMRKAGIRRPERAPNGEFPQRE
ncbi:MAG: hypothetical protein ACLQLG_08850 [Thermoguttaceae bacterium]